MQHGATVAVQVALGTTKTWTSPAQAAYKLGSRQILCRLGQQDWESLNSPLAPWSKWPLPAARDSHEYPLRADLRGLSAWAKSAADSPVHSQQHFEKKKLRDIERSGKHKCQLMSNPRSTLVPKQNWIHFQTNEYSARLIPAMLWKKSEGTAPKQKGYMSKLTRMWKSREVKIHLFFRKVVTPCLGWQRYVGICRVQKDFAWWPEQVLVRTFSQCSVPY